MENSLVGENTVDSIGIFIGDPVREFVTLQRLVLEDLM